MWSSKVFIISHYYKWNLKAAIVLTGFEGPFETIEANVVDARKGDRLCDETLADDAAEGLLHVVEPSLLLALELEATLPEGSVQLKVIDTLMDQFKNKLNFFRINVILKSKL